MAQADFHIDIDGIPGESTTAGYENQIDVLSWSQGATQGGNMHVASGGGAGKASVGDFSFVKYVDSASHLIWIKCMTGKHIKEAVFTCKKAGDNPFEYLKITFTDLLISSVSTGGSQGEAALTESVSLNYAQIKYEYTKQDTETGQADGGAKTAAFNIKENKEA